MKATREIFLVGLLVSALAGASMLSAIEPRLGLLDRFTDELMYYPKGPLVQKACLGHTALAADFAWIRAVQYYGEHKRSDRKFDMMGHLVRIITDLDPKFVNAYIFGGLVMAQDARDVNAALALMEKGLTHNPDDWQMTFETGFMHYTCARNYERAAELFRRSTVLPGATEATMRFAAFVSKRAGDPRASLFLWQEFYNRSNNEEMKARALESIRRLEAELGRTPGGTPHPSGRSGPGTAPLPSTPPSPNLRSEPSAG